MDKLKINKKLRDRIISIFLCFVLVLTIVNIPDLLDKDISALTGDMTYSWATSSGYNFNVKTSSIKTTYSDKGYQTTFKVGDSTTTVEGSNNGIATLNDVTIKTAFRSISDNNYIEISYTVTNNSSTTQTIGIATYSDIMIGSNDSAPVYNLDGNRGFYMTDGTNNFNMLLRNSFGVTDVDTYWYGKYSDRTSKIWSSGTQSSTEYSDLTDIDSGMAFSWQNRTIAAGQTQTYSVALGVGELNNPPTISLSNSLENTYYEGQTVKVSGIVSDEDTTDTVNVKYTIDNGTENTFISNIVTVGGNKSFNGQFTIPSGFTEGQHTLTIWAVDSRGSMSTAISKTFNYKEAWLTSSIDKTSNSNRGAINLDWSSYTQDNVTYKGYQSKDNGATWNSISLMDYSSVSEVKVLQIYPTAAADRQLKTWMETNGYGKGIIKVDSVYIDTFNANPSDYLKKVNNRWTYDVIFFGTWDSNSGKDLTETSKNLVVQFINDSGGVIFGHDTIRTVAQYFMEIGSEYLGMSGSTKTYSGNATSSVPAEGLLSTIKITKKGLFTTYPWNIGELENVLNVPGCHNSQQTSCSDIWLRFTLPTYTSDDYSDENNFYLVTNNNCAMIQTGHSSGQATDDEQKILANLIFYCYQLSESTSTVDYSAMDYAAPNAPTATTTSKSNGKIGINISATDNGTTYQHKIEAYNKSNLTTPIATSNIVKNTVATDIAGYYYVTDNSATNDFNISSATYTTNSSFELNYGNKYIHIKAIDKAGNIGAVSNVELPYQFTVTYNVTENGGTGTISDVKTTVGTNVDLTKTATKTGWTFVGWNIDKDSTTALTSYTMPANDVTLYAIYKKEITLTEIDYNGTTKDTRTKKITIYNKTTSATFTTDTIRTYTGWTVKGWTTGTSATSSNSTTSGGNITISNSTTLYATYTRNISLAYNAQGGNSTPSGTSFTQSANSYNIGSVSTKSVTLASSIGKAGFTFKGWGENSTSGTRYDANSTYILSATTTMHAVWERNKYTVTYDYSENGGTSATKTTDNVYYDYAVDLTPTATKSGWQFVGWNTDKDATTALTSYTMPANDVTLYAIYKKEITLTEIDYNGTTKDTRTNKITIYNKTTSATFTTELIRVYSDWDSVGWTTSTAPDTTDTIFNGDDITISENTTLYAIYKKNVVLTEIDYDGTTKDTRTKSGLRKVNSYNIANIKNPIITTDTIRTYSGWSTRGWTTSTTANADVTYQPGGNIIISADTTIYALYEKHITLTEIDYNGTTKSNRTKTGTRYTNSYDINEIINPTITTDSIRTYTGWTTRGWTKDTAANSDVYYNAGDSIVIKDNLTIYAVYEKKLTATFIDYSNTTKKTRTYTGTKYVNSYNNTSFVNPTVQIPDGNTYSGWNWKGWSAKDVTGNTIGATYSNGQTISFDSSFTCYGLYSRIITLTYDSEGGDTTPSKETFVQETNSYDIGNISKKSIILASSINKTGFTFEGWGENGVNGTRYNQQDTYVLSATTTMHAVWTRNYYTVTYDYSENGGVSATKMSESVLFEYPIDLTPTATKVGDTGTYTQDNPDGWEFVGWNTDKNATIGLTEMNMPAEDVTLYAIYKKTVNFTEIQLDGTKQNPQYNYYEVFNNDTTATHKLLSSPIKCTVDDSTEAQNEWSAIGWTTSTSGKTGLKDLGATVTSTKDVIYYAVYERDLYVHFVDMNGTTQKTTTLTNKQVLNSYTTSNFITPSFTTPSAHVFTYDPVNGAWTFAGWTKDTKTTTSSLVSAGATVKNDANHVYYYALYKRNLTATFVDYKGTTKTTTPITAEQKANANNASKIDSTTITIPIINTYTGWEAIEWADAPDSLEIALNQGNSFTVTKNATYYALYKRTVYANFYRAGSTTPESLSDVQKANASDINGTKTAVTLNSPLIGTYKDSNNLTWSGKYWSLKKTKDAPNDLALNTQFSIKDDTDYYGVYSTNYTATFVSVNNSTSNKQYVSTTVYANANNMSDITEGKVTAPSLKTCKYGGHTWTAEGWTSSNTALNASISVGAEITIPDNNQVFYGVYKSAYTATFIDYDGINQRKRTVDVATKINSSNRTPVITEAKSPAIGIYNDGEEDWIIKGWSSSQNVHDVIDFESEDKFTINENTTYYATYTRDVTVNLVDFVAGASTTTKKTAKAYVNSFNIDNKTDASFTIPAQNGHVTNGKSWNAVGWTTSSSSSSLGDIKYYSAQTISTNKDITIYAMYTRDITVTYNGNGGTNPASSTGTKIINASGATSNPLIQITNTIPVRTSLKFANKWLTGIKSGTEYVPGLYYQFTDDTTLYAQWILETVDLTATINWEDNSNVMNSRPEFIRLSVYRDGQKISSHLVSNLDDTISAPTANKTIPAEGLRVTVDKTTNITTYTFTDLQKYNPSNGAAYNYTLVQEPFVSENAEVDYSTTYSADTWTITNTMVDANNKSITGTIYWYDDSNAWHLRPGNVTLTLLKTNPDTGTVTKQTKTVKVGATDSMDYVFEKQAAVNSNKNPYIYEVTISNIPLYSVSSEIVDDNTFNFECNLTNLPGGFTGGEGNNLIIAADAFNWKGSVAKADDYFATATNEDMSVLVTLKTIKKTWTGNGLNRHEVWDNNKYMTDDKGDIVEYNVIVSPDHNTQVDYLPDGRYELVVHDSSLFDLDKFAAANDELNNATITEDNGRYFITFEAKHDSSSILNLHAQVILKGWRGYTSIKEYMYQPVHVFGDEWVYGDPASCTEDGFKYHVCVLCGARSSQGEIVPAYGHTFVNGVCQECGAVQK